MVCTILLSVIVVNTHTHTHAHTYMHTQHTHAHICKIVSFTFAWPFIPYSLQKDAKKRGALKTLLVSLTHTHTHTHTHARTHTHTHTHTHSLFLLQDKPFLKQGTISSSEFAAWVQRTIEANEYYRKQSSK